MLTLKVIYNQRYQDAMAMTHSEMKEVTGVSIGDMDFRDIRGYGITVLVSESKERRFVTRSCRGTRHQTMRQK